MTQREKPVVVRVGSIRGLLGVWSACPAVVHRGFHGDARRW